MNRDSKRARQTNGRFGSFVPAFTLIETIVVLAIVALISGAIIPVVTRPYVAERQVEAMYEMAEIHTAIAGKPEEGQFGFIGDIAALGSSIDRLGVLVASNVPTNPGLNALMERGSVAAATIGDATSNAPGIVVGWNGPYLRPRFPNALVDPWGSAYRLERDANDTSRWKLRSIGPDHASGTADDVVFPANATDAYFESQGKVTVDLLKANDFGQWPVTAAEAATYTVSMSPKDASPAIDCLQESGTNRFTCTKTWFGQHQVFVHQAAVLRAQKKVALTAPQVVTQVLVPTEGASNTPVSACEKTPAEWAVDTNYAAALQTTLTTEGAFCATKPAVQKFQNIVVNLSGIVTPDADTTECTLTVKMTSDNSAGPWTVAGPIKIKGTTTAVPFTLSGNVVAPTSAVAQGTVTIYASAQASSGGTCNATRPTTPVNASPGSIVMLGHP